MLAIVPAAGAPSRAGDDAGSLSCPWPAGLGYAVLLCWQPLAWLWLLPVATVLLDLTSWTGRPLVNEFDALFLMTLAVALARGEFRGAGAAGLIRCDLPVLAAFSPCCCHRHPTGACSCGRWPITTSNPYYTADYAHKLVKGAVWGAALALLWRAQQQRHPGAPPPRCWPASVSPPACWGRWCCGSAARWACSCRAVPGTTWSTPCST